MCYVDSRESAHVGNCTSGGRGHPKQQTPLVGCMVECGVILKVLTKLT